MPVFIVVEIAVLVALLVCSAFFSSAETALFSLNPGQIQRIQKRHPGAARRIQSLRVVPTKLLSTVLIGNTLVNVVTSVVGYAIIRGVVQWRGLAINPEAIAIPMMPVLLLIFGEVTPKRLAISRPELLAVLYAPVLTGVALVLTPLRVLLESITSALKRHFSPRGGGLTEEEFRSVIDASQEEGVLDKDERTMVAGIIRLEDIEARDVMTPRVDLVGFDMDVPPSSFEETVRKAPFRYLPVYRGDLDHVVGFADVRRFLLDPERDLHKAMIPPLHVPETTPLDTVLATFQRERARVAVVVDEYGGTAGLITRGDILEEIAEEAQNEYGEKKPLVEPLGNNKWFVDGNTSLRDVNYQLGMKLQDNGADRIAGWVTANMERVPRPGESVAAQGCRATVRQMRRTRVTLVLLEKIESPEPSEDREEDE